MSGRLAVIFFEDRIEVVLALTGVFYQKSRHLSLAVGKFFGELGQGEALDVISDVLQHRRDLLREIRVIGEAGHYRPHLRI